MYYILNITDNKILIFSCVLSNVCLTMNEQKCEIITADIIHVMTNSNHFEIPKTIKIIELTGRKHGRITLFDGYSEILDSINPLEIVRSMFGDCEDCRYCIWIDNGNFNEEHLLQNPNMYFEIDNFFEKIKNDENLIKYMEYKIRQNFN